MDNMTISGIILFGGGIVMVVGIYLYIRHNEKKHKHHH